MATEQHPYLFLAVFLVAATLFALVPLTLARIWAKIYSPQKPGEQKNAVYECGLESKQEGHVQFKSEYYLYGIMFLIFDVEAIFLLPFAVSFRHSSVEAFLAMVVFLVLLAEGLAWAWMKGILTWRRSGMPVGTKQAKAAYAANQILKEG